MIFTIQYRFLTYVTFLFFGANVAIFAQSSNEQSDSAQVIQPILTLTPESTTKPIVAITQNDTKAPPQNKWKSILLTEFKYNPPPPDISETATPPPAGEDVVAMERYIVVAQKDKKIEINEAKPTGVKSFDNTMGGTLARYKGKRITTEILNIHPIEGIRFFILSW